MANLDKVGTGERIGGYVGGLVGGAIGVGAFKLAAAALTGTMLTIAGVSVPAIAALSAACFVVGAALWSLAIGTSKSIMPGTFLLAAFSNAFALQLTPGVTTVLGGSWLGSTVVRGFDMGLAAAGLGIGRLIGRQFDRRRAARLEAA